MGNLTKMRSISTAIISLRESLKNQEKRNLTYRKKITDMWSDKKKEEEVATNAVILTIGRAKVRATQVTISVTTFQRTLSKQGCTTL